MLSECATVVRRLPWHHSPFDERRSAMSRGTKWLLAFLTIFLVASWITSPAVIWIAGGTGIAVALFAAIRYWQQR